MLLTHAKLQHLVIEELGRSPAKSTLEELVNEAGEAWVSATQWRYLRDRSQEIATVSGQDDYRLGRGIHTVTAVHRPDTVWPSIPLIAFDEFERLRQQYLARIERTQRPIAATRYNAGPDDEFPRLYLTIFPVDFRERLVIQYNAGWLPLDGLEDSPDLPEMLSKHFVDWLRLYAMSREFPDQVPLGAVDAFRNSHSFRAARTLDGEVATRILKGTGGVERAYSRSRALQGNDRRASLYDLYRFLPEIE